ncbi:TauD/TfdA family dioxygenase [Streptomyces mirabilis]|uniref:TauD/TfdA family dioxygenase n=1 Tax=Streptomyces mirabilis TaxID=68239 RepID=UPI00331E471D
MVALVPSAPAPGTPLLDWVRAHRSDVCRQLSETGLVWLRGFTASEPDVAQELLTLLGVELMEDVFFSTPRSVVTGKTYTATEYPADQRIPLHSEMSYLNTHPRLLCFHALTCAKSGGETAVGDLDAISRDLGDLPARFHDAGVQYRRVFHTGVDIPIDVAFGSDDPSEIAAIADRYQMALHKVDEESTQATYTGPGALRDTVTGQFVWFNQAALHHPARLPASVRTILTEMFGEGCLPRQSYYGDGTPISDSLVGEITAVMDRHTQYLKLHPSDVVLVDNLRWAHGRAPYHGMRTIHVAMGMPCEGSYRKPLFA